MNRRENKHLVLAAVCLFLFGVASARASEVTQTDPAKMAQLGISAFQKGDVQTAIRYLAARANMKPEDANVYYYLGNCYLKTNQNDQAAHMFSACVRVSPSSQAGRYSLTALETLSTMPKQADPPPPDPAAAPPDKAQAAATKDSLMSEKALDQQFNDAVVKIKSYRQGLKSRVDHIWLQMQDEMQALQQRNNPNYAADLEKLQREAEIKVQELQTKELRLESRMMAPEKVDVRAIPQMPSEKVDDTKTALGSLLDYFKPEKPFDPFATELTPDVTSKFLTVKDVFGELSTYQASARRAAKQVFMQLKNSIEMKQDQLDMQLTQIKNNLLHDVVAIKINYGNQTNARNAQQLVNAASYISGAKIPRSDQEKLTPQEQEVSQAVERSKKRIKDAEDTYYHEVDLILAGGKEKLGGMIGQIGQMNKQMQKPSGTIQLVPLGTDTYTRNYINFGERPELRPSANAANKIPAANAANKIPAANAANKIPVTPLHAEAAKKLKPGSARVTSPTRTRSARTGPNYEASCGSPASKSNSRGPN
jgi:O6-methylguanine-DNA--protein-cysteine methyltransferase